MKGITSRVTLWVHYFGVAMLAAMMFLVVADVVMRYIFNKALAGAYEITQFLLVILVSFSLAYCAFKKGHVAVDVIVSHLSKRTRGVIDKFDVFVSFIFFALVTWQSALYIQETYDGKLNSAVLSIPIFPFVAAIMLGSAILSLVFLAEFIESLSKGSDE